MGTRFVLGGALAGALALGACGDSPVAPPVVNNTAPTIESVTISTPRAEANREIQVTASVKDAETPVDQLTYTWSASPQNGTFTGSGAAAMWRPPAGQTTPDLYTIALTVTERFTSAGQPKTNTVSSSATVHYNDSPAEVTFLGKDFLEAKFGNYNVSPAEAVSNFSDSNSCRNSKASELSDVERNRKNFRILSATYSVDAIAFNVDNTRATVRGRCVFEDIPNSGVNAGKPQRVTGICTLTNVYENFRWFLCGSEFSGTGTTLLSLEPGRVPGRIVFE
jgi:hypothetical protein